MTNTMNGNNGWPPEFRLDQERILKLLTGDRFYSNASATLREAILNALDATHRRSEEKSDYKPELLVEFDRTSLCLTVTDNGDGMTRTAVTDLFTKIGASAAEFDPRGKGAIGEFGIGVVSYFMSADEFEIETCSGSEPAIGLKFRKDMFAGGSAEEFAPTRMERGTTLRLQIRSEETFSLLLDRYPYWCRDVQGLTAVENPGGGRLSQGGDPYAEIDPVKVDLTDHIEAASIRPVASAEAWDVMTGVSQVAILYRGVFVQTFDAQGVWGMQGTVHVDPKQFKPRLNREGFVGPEFEPEIDAFLKAAHPIVLSRMVELIEAAIVEGRVSKWSQKRFATLWLSVPRSAPYEDVAVKWDAVFRKVPAFEIYVTKEAKWVPTCLDDLIQIAEPIWVAPQSESRVNDLIKSATRLLRETGKPVIRGLSREPNWLRGAGNYFSTTADLIAQVFAAELPELKHIEPAAEALLAELDAIHSLYSGSEPIELVRLGEDGPPVLRVERRLLINLDDEIGPAIVRYAIDANRGRIALIEATAAVAPQYLSQVATIARAVSEDTEILGLVKRRFIRELVD